MVSFGGGNNVFSSFHLRGDRYARPLSRNEGLLVPYACVRETALQYSRR
jgi:hypothetical protein